LHVSESCDDGNQIANDGCTNCTEDIGFTCTWSNQFTPDECLSVCGDGIKASNEECDDGPISDGDGCSE